MNSDISEEPQQDALLKAVSEIQTIRQNPLLLLFGDDCDRFSLLKTHNALAGHAFDELDVVIQTRRGLPREGFVLAKILRQFAKKVNVLVALHAKGMGLIPCLSSDELIMTYLAELGPLECCIEIYKNGRYKRTSSALLAHKSLSEIPKLIFRAIPAFQQELSVEQCGYSEMVKLSGTIAGSTVKNVYNNLTPKTEMGNVRNELEGGMHYLSLALVRYKKWDYIDAHAMASTFLYEYPGKEFCIDSIELRKLGFTVSQANDQLSQHLILLGTELNNSPDREAVRLFPMSAQP